ncbi:MAG: DUF421 domain-containing protein [Ferruginibacter sp.]|nr:DUF421 domain-containing protein [Ferruginibacter sp.]
MYFPLLKINIFLDIDWRSFLLGTEKWTFLPEVAVRSLLMFLIILLGLRLLGKRSVTQLSVFELGVIIGLGSAAGDPMFYKDVGLLQGVVVFAVVISLSRFMTFLINRSEKIEKVLEGEPVYLAEEGKLNFVNLQKEPIAYEEFFALLRQHNVYHLGQVQIAIIETNGMISLYYFPDEEVRWGLPVLPHLYDKKLTQLTGGRVYACTYCGQVEEIKADKQEQFCLVCGKKEWVEASNNRRIP